MMVVFKVYVIFKGCMKYLEFDIRWWDIICQHIRELWEEKGTQLLHFNAFLVAYDTLGVTIRHMHLPWFLGRHLEVCEVPLLCKIRAWFQNLDPEYWKIANRHPQGPLYIISVHVPVYMFSPGSSPSVLFHLIKCSTGSFKPWLT